MILRCFEFLTRSLLHLAGWKTTSSLDNPCTPWHGISNYIKNMLVSETSERESSWIWSIVTEYKMHSWFPELRLSPSETTIFMLLIYLVCFDSYCCLFITKHFTKVANHRGIKWKSTYLYWLAYQLKGNVFNSEQRRKTLSILIFKGSPCSITLHRFIESID